MPEAPRRDLRVLQIVSLFVIAMAALTPAGIPLAPLPVALSLARGNAAGAALLAIAVTLAASFPETGSALAGLVAASFGIPLGIWSATGVRFTRIVTRTAAMASVLVVGTMSLAVDRMTESLEASRVELEEAVDERGTELDPVAKARWIESTRYTVEQWPYLLPGMAVAALIPAVAFGVALLQIALLRSGGPPIPGSFRDLRPPDWLVWLAIASVAGWYADSEWPNPLIRLLSWNCGFVLMSVYWLNGMAIVAAAVVRFRTPSLLIPIALLLLLPTTHGLLAVTGFFDTWIEFRRRLDGTPPEPTPDDNE